MIGSKYHIATKIAYEKGYRVLDDGTIRGMTKILNPPLTKANGNYFRINIRGYNGERFTVRVHQLAAYQQFGDDAFDDDIEIRHLNNIKTDNSKENIALGTRLENAMDNPPEQRMYFSIKAAEKIRKFSDEEMLEIKEYHSKVRSYKQTMERFGITSKGSLHYMLNKKYKTKK